MRKSMQNCTLYSMATKVHKKGIVTKIYMYILLSYYPYVLAGGGKREWRSREENTLLNRHLTLERSVTHLVNKLVISAIQTNHFNLHWNWNIVSCLKKKALIWPAFAAHSRFIGYSPNGNIHRMRHQCVKICRSWILKN